MPTSFLSFTGSYLTNPSEDFSYHSITLQQGITYDFHTAAYVGAGQDISHDVDTAIFDPETGRYIYSSGYSAPGASWTQLESGTFTLRIDPSTVYSTWGYRIVLDREDVVRSDLGTEHALIDGSEISGTIDVAGDVDTYALEVEAGTTYTITFTDSVGNGALSYGVFEVVDDLGNTIQEHGRNEAYKPIVFTADSSETVFVRVGGDYSDTGDFTLSVASDAYLVEGTGKADRINAAGIDNYIQGYGGADTIFGGDGDDIISGGRGRDELHGGAGTDTLIFTSPKGAVVKMTAGKAKVKKSKEVDTFDGIENVQTGRGRDKIIGDGYDNRLDGGAGNDRLTGGGGDDTLIGGRGRDTLIGGAGNDEFVFSSGFGRDVIRDFTVGEDAIILDGLSEDNLSTRNASGDLQIDTGSGVITVLDVGGADLSDILFFQ
ncbi:calcium-binding protein [Cribrihabitans neustonicus]|uniref:calcium-binding protein n=1 Tax=Cribrihabitans neustonicus TaxID=1429085 RepID=UPI003B59E173